MDLRALPIDQAMGLMLLLLLIGIQMRNSGMHLRRILLSPWGMKIAATVIVSQLARQPAGPHNYWACPLPTGWPMSSSFGWYSLSGILVADKLEPVLPSRLYQRSRARADRHPDHSAS